MLSILRGLEVIAGWWFIFYQLYRPPTKLRRVLLLAGFVAGYVFWYLVPIDEWFARGSALGGVMSDDTANEILWVIILACFALLCGKLRSSLFSALWYIGVEQNVDVIRAYINNLLNGGRYVFNYPQFNVQYLLILVWSYAYYRIRRKFTGSPPLLFELLTALTPLGATVLLTRFSDAIRTPPMADAPRIGFYREGLLIGLFILALNFIMFYLYLRLLMAYETRTFAMEVAGTPPVWTSEAGLSGAFIERYKLSSRERDVIEGIMAGKSNRDIADSLFIAPRTVETHLRNIYQKTGVFNRFALYNLIKG